MSRVVSLAIVATFAWTSASAADTYRAEGVVNAVKNKENKLNITHGPVVGLMAGMTMDFAVLDPVMLDDVKTGSNIKFTLTKDSRGNLVISDLEQVSVTSARK